MSILPGNPEFKGRCESTHMKEAQARIGKRQFSALAYPR